MSSELGFLATITLIFILSVFYIANKPSKQDNEQDTKTTKKSTPKSDEIIDTLDWMLAHNIITPSEYTKLMGKSLPFF